MLSILSVFLQITLRRRGPEDLPASRFLLVAAGLCYVIAQGLLVQPVYHSISALVRSLALDLLLLCGCVWGFLRVTNHAARYLQTLTAMFGTGTLLGVCMLPFNYWLAVAGTPGKTAIGPTVGLLAVLSWSMAVNGHIFSRAMSVPFVPALAIAIGYFFLNYMVFVQLGPSPA